MKLILIVGFFVSAASTKFAIQHMYIGTKHCMKPSSMIVVQPHPASCIDMNCFQIPGGRSSVSVECADSPKSSVYPVPTVPGGGKYLRAQGKDVQVYYKTGCIEMPNRGPMKLECGKQGKVSVRLCDQGCAKCYPAFSDAALGYNFPELKCVQLRDSRGL